MSVLPCRKYRQGPPGSSTEQGPPGIDGVDGRDGVDGTNGRDGVDGKDGRDGAPGNDGRDGRDGAQGPIGPPGPGTAITWTNGTVRLTIVPNFIGQIGIQLSDNTQWVSNGLTAGDWIPVPFNLRTTPDAAGRSAAIPNYIGEPLLQLDSNVLYRGTALTAGQWTPIVSETVTDPPITTITIPVLTSTTPVPPPVIPAETIDNWFVVPVQTNAKSAVLTVARPGGVDNVLVIRVLLPDSGRTLTTSDITVPAGETKVIIAEGDLTTSVKGTLDPETHIWSDGIAAGEKLQFQVISQGIVVTGATVTDGSTQVTIPTISIPKTLPGTQIQPTNGVNSFVLAINQDGTLRTSNAANATSGSASITARQRLSARGIFALTLVAGDTVVPASAQDVIFIRPGDMVVGDTVTEGTTVLSVDYATPEIVLSKPLTGATTQLGFLSERPRIVTHTAVSGFTVGEQVHVLATVDGVKNGWAVRGPNIPANTMVDVDSGSEAISLQDATSGGSAVTTGTVTELSFSPPEREATGAVGDTTISIQRFGIFHGMKISGPGVQEKTYVSGNTSPAGISTASVTITKSLTASITSEVLTFTDEESLMTCGITNGDATLSLPTTAVNTAIEEGDLVVAVNGIPEGTYVDSIGASTIELSKPATLTNVAAVVTFIKQPAYAGLTLNLSAYVSA